MSGARSMGGIGNDDQIELQTLRLVYGHQLHGFAGLDGCFALACRHVAHGSDIVYEFREADQTAGVRIGQQLVHVANRPLAKALLCGVLSAQLAQAGAIVRLVQKHLEHGRHAYAANQTRRGA